jgi:PadR family transcriptional regulator PadR
MSPISVNDELKKGSAELLILTLLEPRRRHGYEISRLIEERSGGVIRFHVASFYPLLYRMERRGLIEGKWVEKSGQRRRRYYRLTSEGRARLKQQRSVWREFAAAMNHMTEASNA